MRLIFLCILLFLIPAVTYAQDLFPEELLPTIAVDPGRVLKGGQYQLELAPLESDQPTRSAKIKESLNTQERKQFDTKGFIVRQSKGELKLALSSVRIGLGSIAGAGIHSGKTEIAVSTDTNTGYSLLMAQARPDENSIWRFQPTICDGMRNTCTPLSSAIWKKTTLYGFGYTLSGPDTPSDFNKGSYFRPLRVDDPVMIAGNEKISGIRTLTITYKLNAPPTTEEAIYNTNVEVIALSK